MRRADFAVVVVFFGYEEDLVFFLVDIAGE